MILHEWLHQYENDSQVDLDLTNPPGPLEKAKPTVRPVATEVVTANLPPGPRGLAHWKTEFNFLRDSLNTPIKLTAKYGELVQIRPEVYLVGSPELIEQLFLNYDHFDKQFNDSYGEWGELFWGNSLLVKPWGGWLEHRRLLQAALQRDRMIAYSQVMVEYAARAISSWPRNQAFDLHKRLMRLTLEITIKNVLGLDFSGSETDTIITSLETTLRLFGDKAERLLEMDTPLKQAFRSGVAQLDELVYRAIAQRRLQSAQDQGDMLSVLMSLTKPDGSQLSDKELRDEVVTLLRAGHRNTSTLLAWVFVALAQNPSVTAKLHTELDRVLGLPSQAQSRKGQLPTPANLPALRYSEMVIKETLRLYPLYPTNVRKVIQSCQLAGYTIPAGSRVVASVWAAHRNPHYFDQPTNFKPERWSSNYSPTTSLAVPVPKYAYFPFGGGPRQCPFKAYGMLEAVLLLAVIAQQYQVKLAPSYKLKFQATANGLLPKGGLQVILSEH